MNKTVNLIHIEANPDLYAQRICTSCGLCCDGSIFKRARVFPDENAALFETLDLQILHLKDGRRCFLLPCRHLQGSICSIYEKTRPRKCSEFRCKLLERFYNQDISYKDACEVVINAVEHVRQVKSQLVLKGNSECSSLDGLFEAWQKNCVTENSATAMNYHSLQFRFDRDFRLNKDK